MASPLGSFGSTIPANSLTHSTSTDPIIPNPAPACPSHPDDDCDSALISQSSLNSTEPVSQKVWNVRLIPPSQIIESGSLRKTATKSSTIGNNSISPTNSIANPNPNIFGQIQQTLEPRIRNIENLTGDFDQVFRALLEKAGDKKELKEKLESIGMLASDAQKARNDYIKHYDEYKRLQTILIETAHILDQLLRRYASSFDYLEGPGKYEEYDYCQNDDLAECNENFETLLQLSGQAFSTQIELLNPSELQDFATNCKDLVCQLISLPGEDYLKREENIRQLKEGRSVFEPFLKHHCIEGFEIDDDSDHNDDVSISGSSNEKSQEEKVKEVVIDFLLWLKGFIEYRANPRSIQQALSTRALFRALSFEDQEGEEYDKENEYERQFQALGAVINDFDKLAACFDLDQTELSNLKQFALSGKELVGPLVPLDKERNIKDQIATLKDIFSRFSGIQNTLSPPYNPTQEEEIIEGVNGFWSWFDERIQKSEQENDFTIHLAQREVFRAIEASKNPKKIMKKFNSSKEELAELLALLDKQIENPDANFETFPLIQTIDISLDVIKDVLICILEAIEIKLEELDNLDYDERDSNTTFVNNILEKEAEKFYGMADQCDHFRNQLRDCLDRLRTYNDLTTQLEISGEIYIAAQFKLINTLNSLKGKRKKPSSADISTQLSTLPSVSVKGRGMSNNSIFC